MIHSDNALELPNPRHMLLENINPFHQHIDMIYFAQANSFEVTPEEGESLELRWFSIQELEGREIENDIKLLGQEAIELIKKAQK